MHHARSKNTLGALLLLGSLVSCNAHPQADANKYGRYLGEAHARGQFNGVALVYDHGEVVYQGAFGVRDIGTNDTLDLDSRFRLASVSKQFTAMAIALLKQSGKLRYDQDIRDFLPELPYQGITVRHLVHHLGGLPDYEPLMDQYWKPELKYDDPARYTNGNDDVLRMLVERRPPVLFAPGERWQYSNTGYNLLGTIVARASGLSFAHYLQQHIFDPAGMAHTTVYPFVVGHDPLMPDRAFGFGLRWNGTDRVPADSHYLNHGVGEDGVYSTVGDLLKWDRILYTNELLPQAARDELFAPGVLNNGNATNYAFGWFIEQSPTGKRAMQHSGGWLSFSTFIYRAVDEDKCFVLLRNNSATPLWGLVDGMKNLLYGKPAELPPLQLRRTLGAVVASRGVEAAVARYQQMKTDGTAELGNSEAELNMLGYELLWDGRVDDAVAVLGLVVQEHPGSANAYDSHGDALLAKGDTTGALRQFKKTVAMDATFTATQQKIDALEKGR